MRPFVLPVLSLLLSLSACSTSTVEELEIQAAELELEVHRLQDQLDEARAYAEQMSDRISDLEAEILVAEAEVEEFAYHDWRQVVPVVHSSISTIRWKFTEVQSSAQDLAELLTQ